MLQHTFDYSRFLKEILKSPEPILSQGQAHGLERECLRVTPQGELAQSPHPHSLGSSLTHPSITTDFSESQIEFTTGTHQRLDGLLQELEELQNYVCTSLKKELLWPLSMPARLPESELGIPLARFGSSSIGQKKTIYRRGLGYRYGRRMQTISGIHYNFSIGSPLRDYLYQKFIKEQGSSPDSEYTKTQFQSDLYLKTIRNYMRISPVLPYLFGASPAFDQSFLDKSDKELEQLQLQRLGQSTWYAPYASSLRMSSIGYTNSYQSQLNISYNNLNDYISDLRSAINRPCPEYEKWSANDGLQLNSNVLQIENEHYALIRPKPRLDQHSSVLNALEANGVCYIEVRALDLNPFHPIAVDSRQLCFVHLLLLDCMFRSSPELGSEESDHISKQFQKVVWSGREQNCIQLQGGNIKRFGLQLCDQLECYAFKLDRELGSDNYQNALHHARILFEHPSETPSAQLLESIRDRGEMIDYGLSIAKHHCRYFGQHMLSKEVIQKLDRLVQESHAKQAQIEQLERAHIA